MDKQEITETISETSPWAPLAHLKTPVVLFATVVVAFLIFRASAYHFGLTTFLAVGLSINAGLVFGVILHFYPRVNIAISVVVMLMAGLVGSVGFWLLAVSLAVYFLTTFRAGD